MLIQYFQIILILTFNQYPNSALDSRQIVSKCVKYWMTIYHTNQVTHNYNNWVLHNGDILVTELSKLSACKVQFSRCVTFSQIAWRIFHIFQAFISSIFQIYYQNIVSILIISYKNDQKSIKININERICKSMGKQHIA